MNTLTIPRPTSVGIMLSYKCTCNCKHCMYACSPKWPDDWLPLDDARTIISQLAELLPPHIRPGYVGLNHGLHFTGGEPFMNYSLLLNCTAMAKEMGIHSIFVETNAFWSRDDDTARRMLTDLKTAGLNGILISANPFVVEHVPFERVQRAARISEELFPGGVMVYQQYFYRQFQQAGLTRTMSFEKYAKKAKRSLGHVELFANGRAPYKLGALFKHYAAEHFFGSACERELIRDWHIHIDNYGNYVPGYCGGLTLGDARDIEDLCWGGIDLDQHPILDALLTDIELLYEIAVSRGYRECEGGYISKCHLCADTRRYLYPRGPFRELAPAGFYEHLQN